METITISKREYKTLVSRAKAYERLAKSIFVNAIQDPISDIVSDFRKTDLYTEEFQLDLEEGLKKSSLSKKNRDISEVNF